VLSDPYSLESSNALRTDAESSSGETPRPPPSTNPAPVAPSETVEYRPTPTPSTRDPSSGAGGQPAQPEPLPTSGQTPADVPMPDPTIAQADAGTPIEVPQAPAPDAGSAMCGDSTRQGNEACDGTDLAQQSCVSLDPATYVGGSLACDGSCRFDTSACEVVPTTECGNGIAEDGEDCDGDDLRSQGCTDAEFTGGKLSCNSNCELDFSQCTSEQACDAVSPTRTGVVYRGDTSGAPSRHNTYSCTAGGKGGDVSIAWSAPFSGCFQIIVTSDSDLDTIAAVYPDCVSFSELSCDDNSGTDQFSVAEFDAVVGTTYAIVLDAYFASDEGPLTLRISPCAPPQWQCGNEFYGRGDGCDCGCGTVDYDCDDANRASCDICDGVGSCAQSGSCSEVNDIENWRCGP